MMFRSRRDSTDFPVELPATICGYLIYAMLLNAAICDWEGRREEEHASGSGSSMMRAWPLIEKARKMLSVSTGAAYDSSGGKWVSLEGTGMKREGLFFGAFFLWGEAVFVLGASPFRPKGSAYDLAIGITCTRVMNKQKKCNAMQSSYSLGPPDSCSQATPNH